MTTFSKIRYFFILTALLILPGSCNKDKNDVIPYAYVDFTLDMMDFLNIYGIVGSDTVDANDMRVDQGRQFAGGFDDNGIIIFFGGDGYYAYDRTCPHDWEVNGLSVKVNIDFTIATCPKCGTTYALAAGGAPIPGSVGNYYLKPYRTSLNGRFLSVWNY